MRRPCWLEHAAFFRGRLRVLYELGRYPVTATLTFDPRLVAALRPAMLELPDPAIDLELREVVLTMARELLEQGASAGTVHGTILGQCWSICCELSRVRVESGPRCEAIRDQVGEWIGELWPSGILPRSRGKSSR